MVQFFGGVPLAPKSTIQHPRYRIHITNDIEALGNGVIRKRPAINSPITRQPLDPLAKLHEEFSMTLVVITGYGPPALHTPAHVLTAMMKNWDREWRRKMDESRVEIR